MKKLSIVMAIATVMLFINGCGESSYQKPVVCIGNIVNKSGQDLNTETFVTRLNNALVNTDHFDVIENDRIDEIIEEWNKANAGMTKSSSDAENQKIAEVGYKLVPTITAFEYKSNTVNIGEATVQKNIARLSLCVRFLRVSDGQIIAAKEIVGESSRTTTEVSGTASSNSGSMFYQDCVKDAAQKVVDALMDLCAPIETMENEKGDEVTIRVQSERVKEGDFFKVYYIEGEVEKEIATIKVTDVRPTQSTCKVISRKEAMTINAGDICRPVNPVKQKRSSTAFDDL